VDGFCQNVRFVPEQGHWFIWNGSRWQIDTDGAMERLALRLSGNVFQMAVAMPAKDEDKRRKAIAEALKYGDRRHIQNYLALARTDRRVILSNTCLIPKP